MVRRDLVSLFTRIGSWVLTYLSWALILYVGIDSLNYLLTHGPSIQFLPAALSKMVVFVILIIFGDLLGTISNRIDDEIERQLVGFLLSTIGPTPAEKVAAYLNISTKHATKTFFKLKSKGMLKDFIFDSDHSEIIPPQTGSEKSFTNSSKIADELLKRAKLKELERLKASGEISEEAYRELRKELEGV